MATATIQTLEKEVNGLKREISEIKQVFLGGIKDKEGSYKTGFVREVLNIAKKRPLYHYNKKDFLKRVA